MKATATKVNTGYAVGTGCVDAAAALGIETTVPVPASSIENGEKIASGTEIELTELNEDAVIYYTLNGKTPTPNDLDQTDTQIYEDTTKISLSGKNSITVKAVAVLYGKTSAVATYTYQYDDSMISDIQVIAKNGSNGVAIGKTLALQAAIQPEYARNQKILWSSSDTSIATVDASGVVKGLACGEVIITATAADGSDKKGTIDLSVKEPVTSITIRDDSKIELTIDDTYELSLYDPLSQSGKIMVIPSYATQDLVYQSSNVKVATVDDNGLVTAVASGTSKITVTAADGTGIKDTITVKVLTPIQNIEIIDTAGLNKVAAGQILTPMVLFNNGENKPDNTELVWTVTAGTNYVDINTKSGAVTVDKNLDALRKVTIRATSKKDETIYGELTFYVYPKTIDIITNTSAYTMKIKVAKIFRTEFVQSTEPENTLGIYQYTSSNPKVVAINPKTGYFRALKSGTTVLTMAAQDGSKVKKSVTVTVTALEKVGVVNDNPRVLYPGKSITLKPNVVPSSEKLANNAYNQEWSVYRNGIYDSENYYLKVKNGKVMAKKTVQSITSGALWNVRFRYWCSEEDYREHYDETGYYYQFITPVELYPAGTATVILDDTESTMVIGEQVTLHPSSMPEKACQKYYTYKTSNVKVAKVYENGVVMAVGNGKANITVTAGDGSGKTAVYQVTVAEPVTTIEVSGKNDQTVLCAGKTLQMLAITNKNAANQKVNWMFADEIDNDYATINSKGVLTAKKTVTEEHVITVVAVATDESEVRGSKEITLYPAVSAIELSKDKLLLGTATLGEYHNSGTLTIQGKPANAFTNEYKVTSSKPEVASVVCENGIVTVNAIKKGTTDIRVAAVDGSGKYAICKVTVQEPVTKLEIKSKNGMYELASGKSLQMVATSNAGANNKKVIWHFTEDTMKNYAELNAKTGVVKAKNVTEKQTISVYALAEDAGQEVSEAKNITVYPVSVASIKVNSLEEPYSEVKNVTLCIGESIGTLNDGVSYKVNTYTTAGVSSENICPMSTAKSSNNAVAKAVTYENAGQQYIDIDAGTKPGKATITVTTNDGSNKAAKITVTTIKPIRNLNIKSKTGQYSAAYGTKLQLQATTTSDATNKKIVWELEEVDRDCAVLTSGGLLKPIMGRTEPRRITVKAKAQDGSGVVAEKEIDLYPKASAIEISGANTVHVGESISMTVNSTSPYETYSKYAITYTTGSAKVYLQNDEGTEFKVVGLKKVQPKLQQQRWMEVE